jgi:hypothetical protein
MGFREMGTHFLTEPAEKAKRNLLLASSLGLLTSLYSLLGSEALKMKSVLGFSFEHTFSFIEIQIPLSVFIIYFFINFYLRGQECRKAYRNYHSTLIDSVTWQSNIASHDATMHNAANTYSKIAPMLEELKLVIEKQYDDKGVIMDELIKNHLSQIKSFSYRSAQTYDSVNSRMEEILKRMDRNFVESEKKVFFIDYDFPLIYGLYSMVLTVGTAVKYFY